MRITLITLPLDPTQQRSCHMCGKDMEAGDRVWSEDDTDILYCTIQCSLQHAKNMLVVNKTGRKEAELK